MTFNIIAIIAGLTFNAIQLRVQKNILQKVLVEQTQTPDGL